MTKIVALGLLFIFSSLPLEAEFVPWVTTENSWTKEDLRKALDPHIKSVEMEWSDDLASIALERARAMAREGRLSHVDGWGRGPGQRWAARGGEVGIVGEILGSAGVLQDLVAAWLKSPSHFGVLQRDDWQRWGWGMVPVGKTWVVVIMFWRP